MHQIIELSSQPIFVVIIFVIATIGFIVYGVTKTAAIFLAAGTTFIWYMLRMEMGFIHSTIFLIFAAILASFA